MINSKQLVFLQDQFNYNRDHLNHNDSNFPRISQFQYIHFDLIDNCMMNQLRNTFFISKISDFELKRIFLFLFKIPKNLKAKTGLFCSILLQKNILHLSNNSLVCRATKLYYKVILVQML